MNQIILLLGIILGILLSFLVLWGTEKAAKNKEILEKSLTEPGEIQQLTSQFFDPSTEAEKWKIAESIEDLLKDN